MALTWILAAALVTVTYEDEMCSCKGQVDPAKADPKVVEASFPFATSREPLRDASGPIWTQLAKMGKPALEVAYANAKVANAAYLKQLEDYKLPGGKVWSELRKARLFDARLDNWLDERTFGFLLFGKTDALRDDFEGHELPKKCLDAVDRLPKAPGRKEQVDVLMFGWSNCVIQALRARDGLDKLTKKALTEAKSQLTGESCACDHP